MGYAITVPFLPLLPMPLWQSVMMVSGNQPYPSMGDVLCVDPNPAKLGAMYGYEVTGSDDSVSGIAVALPASASASPGVPVC